ncbi:hypothetical protein SAMN05444372_107104 [Flavobacterium micromati]|uniref:Uncharacterized protein n=1 Tax=Flavobacterium micromati TaxID=229205 RepID=A0A1M5KVD2_9FLAO|nr:hypothetical protein [Flavobacterium micromati]SHG56728.1 hypothetical protein SAMN05444372_107104 [Flavobacterium micromati]
MDWIKKIIEIKEKLSDNGYRNSLDKITNAQMIFGTTGEMYLEVMNVLLIIKQTNLPELVLIEKDIDELLKYGNDIGYFVLE